MKKIQWEHIIRIRPELKARESEKEYWLQLYEEEPELLFADDAGPTPEPRSYLLRERDGACDRPSSTLDAHASFEGDAGELDEKSGACHGLGEAILRDALENALRDLVLQGATDKQSLVLQQLVRFTQGDWGNAVLGIVDDQMAINASALTERINALSVEQRRGKTVTVPTVQAAVKRLFERLEKSGYRRGRLRGRGGRMR